MLDPEKVAELDQATATMSEFLPPIWWQLYSRCQEEGFTETQAFELVKTFILANGSTKTS